MTRPRCYCGHLSELHSQTEPGWCRVGRCQCTGWKPIPNLSRMREKQASVMFPITTTQGLDAEQISEQIVLSRRIRRRKAKRRPRSAVAVLAEIARKHPPKA